MMTQLLTRLERLGLSIHLDMPALLNLLAQAPASEQLIASMIRQLDRDAELFTRQPSLFGLVIRLIMQGDYPQRMLEHDPFLIHYIAAHHDVAFDEEELEQQLRVDVNLAMSEAASPRDATMEALRVFKRRVSLTIYAREIQGIYSVRETSAAIAALATVSLRVALEQAAALHDDPAIAEEICVLGMGKLGGQELNYSSDIDLILMCSEALDAPRHRRAVQVVRTMVNLIDEPTAQGYVFRVDLRLRPDGALGALLPSASALINYYMSSGRTWERSAMLKARPVAGDLALGQRVIEQLDPFIYKRYLDFKAIDELREMKQMVNANARASRVSGKPVSAPLDQSHTPTLAPKPSSKLNPRKPSRFGAHTTSSAAARMSMRRARAMSTHRAAVQPVTPEPGPVAEQATSGGVLEWDVKIGEGGIREIEFFVQALQLVHCGTRPALRVRGTLDTLDRLLYTGLIPHDDYAALADAYDFYRRVEHRIQMERDRQAHALPATTQALTELARRMDLALDEFLRIVLAHRRAVSEIFARLFSQSEQEAQKPTLKHAKHDDLEHLLLHITSLDDARHLELLERAGFTRPKQVAGQLQMLAQKAHGPFAQHAASRELGAYLIRTSAAAPDPEQAIGFISRMVSQVGDRAWFWQMLDENPHATRLLVHVFGSSELLGKILLRDPNVIHRLLGAGSVAVEQSAESMQAELATSLSRIEDPAHRMGIIHRFQQEHFLRLGLHEIGGAATTDATTRQLGELAEITLGAVLQEVWSNLRKTRKLEQAPESCHEIPFCVVAFGKFGGLELGFGSDLDLIFVLEPDEAMGLDLELGARLAQRLVRALSALSAQGRFYEVDTRLRPSGRQGALVVTCESLRDYHLTRAGVWERQSLCRARPVTGAPWLREKIGRLRLELAFERELPEGLSRTMGQMRARMVQGLPPESQRGFDIKQSQGGLIDLEYITQYLQFWLAARHDAHAASLEVLRGARCDVGERSQNTREALCALAEHRMVQRGFPELDLGQLARDYMVLRRVELRLKLGAQSRDAILPEDRGALTELARTLGFQGEEALGQLDHMLASLRARVKVGFASIFEAPKSE